MSDRLGHNVGSMMKTLKQEGVPLGARMLFRAQHGWFLFMAACLVLTIPFAAMWGFVHESGDDFIEGVTEVLQDRLERVNSHRERLVRLYGGFVA